MVLLDASSISTINTPLNYVYDLKANLARTGYLPVRGIIRGQSLGNIAGKK